MFKLSLLLLAVAVIRISECVCDNCERCLNDKCIDKDNNRCNCELGCKLGYFGKACKQDCPKRCVTCGRDFGEEGDPTYHICYECASGFHNGSSTSCLCPQNCERCVSTTSCTACKNGWYGGACQSNCPANCKSCTSSSSCTSCKDGWYNTTCQSRCSKNCVNNVCRQDDGYCTHGCTVGIWGYRCWNNCPASCTGNVCSRNRGTCTNGCKDNFAQTDDGKCSVCAQGKYGDNCQHRCLSITCKDNVCDKGDGKCKTCKKNFDLGPNGLCETCVSGWYGSNCDTNCLSRRCLNNQCSRNDGTCPNGCDLPTIIGQLCDRCVSGKYGNDCNLDCPFNCKNYRCNRNSGACTNGCKNDFFRGDKCEQCKDGYYGEQCYIPCPVNCQGNVCDKDSGDCTNGCIEMFRGKKCDTCINGFYGPACDTQCPSLKCAKNNCDQSTGLCANGCQASYTGDLCCINNGRCNTCKNATTCLVCQDGFHGVTCNEHCPRNCDGGCIKSNGDCLLCKNGFYGPRCEKKCPDRCVANVCDSNTGRCLQGCISGYYSGQCSESCSINCLDSYCAQDTGRCTECVESFHGATCEKACSRLCINATCTQDGGICIHGCSSGSNGSCVSLPISGSSSVVGSVAGGISGVIVLILVVAFALVLLHRRKRNGEDPCGIVNKLTSVGKKSKSPPFLSLDTKVEFHNETTNQRGTIDFESDELRSEVDNGANEIDGVMNESEYGNLGEARQALNVSELYHFITATDPEIITGEFRQIPRSMSKPRTDALKPTNKSLNRFKGIYPYDHSRVKLNEDPDFYINACYIDGYNAPKSYIASVGPTADITDKYISFWKMAWYERADVIVMLTNLNEASGMKCEQYWPDADMTIVYGDISVTNDGTDVYAEYNLTRLSVSQGGQRRKMTHLQYTAWPDKSVPDNVVSLVEFRQRAKSIVPINGGPMIVHCSAGVGRTGTFIALDILTEQGRSEQMVNVAQCVWRLREQRVNLVQTPEQYDYLFRCIVYTLVFDSDPLFKDRITDYVASLDDQACTRLFEMLECTVEKESVDQKAVMEINKQHTDKNRQGADVPGDKYCPSQLLDISISEVDYINATLIDGFKHKNRFIVAQTPLKETVKDFLHMVFGTRCMCIVDMNDSMSSPEQNVGVYIPAVAEILKAGSIFLKCTRSMKTSTYIKSLLTFKSKSKQIPSEIHVEHYRYTGWKPESDVPDNINDFVQFVNDIRNVGDNSSQSTSRPIVVHCLDAYTRSALVCTLAILLEKIEIEHPVSIDNTIRQVRQRRGKTIPNTAQYKFVHECLQAYLDTFSVYSNFPPP